MASNTLFPPIMDTYQPVFIKDKGECRIYFRFSSYNSESDINRYLIQVSLIDPNTNRSVLVDCPNKIAICSLINENGNYYITLDKNYYYKEDKSILALNQYYKVQIRFTEADVELKGNITSEWLSTNASKFSEWSAVTLIRNIDQPTLNLVNFKKGAENELITCTEIQGNLSFGNNDIEQDALESYQIVITRNEDGKVIEDSGKVYISDYTSNQFNYRLERRLKYNIGYTLKVAYTTLAGYSTEKDPDEYIFTINISTQSTAPMTIKVDPDSNTGVIQVCVGMDEGFSYDGRLILYRTSYISGFQTWDTLIDMSISTKAKNENEKETELGFPLKFYYWNDTTAESGVVYKYAVEYIGNKIQDSKDQKYVDYSYSESVQTLVEFDDIFLENKNVQFKVKFNPTLTNFKYVVNESITNTLGSKYPFVRRNGNNNYRQFSVGGLITFLSEPETEDDIVDSRGYIVEQYPTNSLFLSRNEAMKIAFNFYKDYNYKNGVMDITDYIFEKIYRDKAIEFLCDNTVKLYKSNTEGNILVRLTNISFTPTANLGRLTYSFSATATEIDDCTIENYYKYNILEDPNGDYDTSYVLEAIKRQGTTAYVKQSEILVNPDKAPDDKNVLQLRQIKIKK